MRPLLRLSPQPLGNGSPHALGSLLPQLTLCFQLDELHEVFDSRVALEFIALIVGQGAVALAGDQRVRAISHVRGRTESDELLRRWMLCQESGDLQRGLCPQQQRRNPLCD